MTGVLSERQQDIIVGLLLGDGSLEFDGFKASRLQIKQARSKKDYVFWLYEEFKDFVHTAPKERQDTHQWYFATRSLRGLEPYRLSFYHEGRKIVPDTIKELIRNPITLAVWFMDDGSLDHRPGYHYSYSFATDAFTISEVEQLKQILWDRFGILSSIQTPRSRGTPYTKLYIGKDGRDAFLKAVRPYVLDCFSYKIPLKNIN